VSREAKVESELYKLLGNALEKRESTIVLKFYVSTDDNPNRIKVGDVQNQDKEMF